MTAEMFVYGALLSATLLALAASGALCGLVLGLVPRIAARRRKGNR
jgi:hypothetical protein